MTPAEQIVQDIERAGGRLQAVAGELKLRTRLTVPKVMLDRIREHKAELLDMLTPPESHADRELDRFTATAVADPGNRLRDPAVPAEIVTAIRTAGTCESDTHGAPRGWTREGWRDELHRMAKACRETNPARSAELLAMAESMTVALDTHPKKHIVSTP